MTRRYFAIHIDTGMIDEFDTWEERKAWMRENPKLKPISNKHYRVRRYLANINEPWTTERTLQRCMNVASQKSGKTLLDG